MHINKINRYKFSVVHEYFGHDDRDCYTNESHYILQTDDLQEACRAAAKYTHEHQVGRYYEDGNVVIQTDEKQWNDYHQRWETVRVSRSSFALIQSLKHGPVLWEPEDETAPDWIPF